MSSAFKFRAKVVTLCAGIEGTLVRHESVLIPANLTAAWLNVYTYIPTENLRPDNLCCHKSRTIQQKISDRQA